MTTNELRAALEALCQQYGIECATRCGNERGTMMVYPSVREHADGCVILALETSATITTRRAIDTLNAMRLELAKLPGSESTLKKRKLDTAGFWNMGHFSVTSVFSTHYSSKSEQAIKRFTKAA